MQHWHVVSAYKHGMFGITYIIQETKKVYGGSERITEHEYTRDLNAHDWATSNATIGVGSCVVRGGDIKIDRWEWREVTPDEYSGFVVGKALTPATVPPTQK